jgi:fructose 1,6-bisphosphate aldolase/phosphatase
VIESVTSRSTDEQAVSMSSSRLHNIAGKYTGKDDPVMLIRVQTEFPATGGVLAPNAIGPYVAGCMRGSQQMPLMPVPRNSGISYFDGPPVVNCAVFAVHEGKLTEAVDAFAHPFRERYGIPCPTRPSVCVARAFSAPPCCRCRNWSTPGSWKS